MNPWTGTGNAIARRVFLGRSVTGLGGLVLSSLLGGEGVVRGATPIKPRARRVIFLFMSGGPSHVDLFDPKPRLRDWAGQELPASVRDGQRLSANTAQQNQLLLVGSPYRFVRHGSAGTELSELLPHTGKIVDDIALVRTLRTDSINHDPAVTFLMTGSLQPGRPTFGSWVSYGLGNPSKNLPEYVVLLSGEGGQPLRARYWGQGFLPSNHQGVPFRSTGAPVLYVSNPPGMNDESRRSVLDGLRELNETRRAVSGDPEIAARINSYEMAYRMQTAVPELMDLQTEPRAARELYGAEPGRSSFANNCLLARRLVERGVRFVQLFHRDWDHHGDLPRNLPRQCRLTDRPAAALIQDLKQRGLLDDTLVIWGGEFGRTPFGQGKITPDRFGRDHHSRSFSIWLAGGGIRPGMVLGQTDEFGYNAVVDSVHVHDLQATILHCLGIDHAKLTFRSQGRNFRLTDVGGQVVPQLLA